VQLDKELDNVGGLHLFINHKGNTDFGATILSESSIYFCVD